MKQLQILTDTFSFSLDDFPGAKKLSEELLSVDSVPMFLLGKIVEWERQISSLYSSSNTGNIYVLQPVS